MTEGSGEQTAREFFKNDPRWRSSGTLPYTEDEMAVMEEHGCQLNGSDAFTFAEAYASSRDSQGVKELRSALERTLWNFKLLLAQKPVKEATECIAESEAALRNAGSGEKGT